MGRDHRVEGAQDLSASSREERDGSDDDGDER